MIACRIAHLEARCRQRGYTIEEVRACIVSEQGDQIIVDERHQAYPRERKPGYQPPGLEANGPGTELKKLLAKVGITATPDCACNAKAREMDARGCDWVEENEATVVGWLREEAAKRRLPFFDAAGRVLVRRAIANARKEQARAGGSPRHH
jgi:hypothetical protein